MNSESHPENYGIDFSYSKELNSFTSAGTASKDLCEQTTHLCKMIEQRVTGVFRDLKFSVKFDRAIMKMLTSEKSSIPYETYGDKDNESEVPVVAVLSLGTPRPFSLKTARGHRVTHHVALHSGSLLLMADQTQNKYVHSIPKGIGHSKQIVFFFVGTALYHEEPLKHQHLVSEDETDFSDTSEGTTDFSDDQSGTGRDSLPEYQLIHESQEIHIPTGIIIPEITVSKLDNNGAGSENDKTVTTSQPKESNQQPESTQSISLGYAAAEKEDVELDKTVIRATSKDDDLLLCETIITCINNMPLDDLESELQKHGCPVTGSAQSKRTKLIALISTRIGTLMNKTEDEDTNDQYTDMEKISRVQSSMEKTMLDINIHIAIMADELTALKDKVCSPEKESAKAKDSTDVKDMKAMWIKNNATLNHLNRKTSELSDNINATLEKAKAAEDIVKQTQGDLQRWYNSAFYKEDSRLIKDIHDYISTDTAGYEHLRRGTQTGNTKPLRSELIEDTVNTPMTQPNKVPTSSFSDVLGSQPPTNLLLYAKKSDIQSPSASNMTYSKHPPRSTSQRSESEPTIPSAQSTPQSTNFMWAIIPSAMPVQRNAPSHLHQSLPTTNPLATDPSLNPTQVVWSQIPTAMSAHQITHSHQPVTTQSMPQTYDTRTPPYTRNSSQQVSQTSQLYSQRSPDNQNNPTARKYRTVLITDSIMSCINDKDLGENHDLYKIRKRHSSGLVNRTEQTTVLAVKPDYIYIHLGINDLFDKVPIDTIITNFDDFLLFTDERLPKSKVIISFPLLTDDVNDRKRILDLRKHLMKWILYREQDEGVGIENRRLIFNSNTNFLKRTEDHSGAPTFGQVKDLFDRRGVHLTDKGKEVILRNFRFCINDITRRISSNSSGVASR